MAREIKIACCVGALAGITPLLVSLISVDAELIANGFDRMIIIGYLIKVAGMMALGAFVVFVNSESDFKKAFQLGLMAPALIVGTINASNLSDAKRDLETLGEDLEGSASTSPAEHHDVTYMFQDRGFGFSLISSAYAESTNNLIGKHYKPTMASKVWYGISGSMPDGWFVIVGLHKQQRDADGQAQELRNRGYDARVIPSLEDSDNYGVAIGSHLTLNKARELKRQAIEDGLSDNTYLSKWK
jgi:hypothetical protein